MKNKVISMLLAFAMILSVFALPLCAFAQNTQGNDPANQPKARLDQDPNHKTDVVIHKILMKSVQGWPKEPGAVGSDGQTKYDGSKIQDLTKYFGDETKELANVKFIYWKVTAEQYKILTAEANKGKYDTVDKVKNAGTEEVKLANLGDGTEITTTANGAEVELADGYYWFVEDTNTVKDPAHPGDTWSDAAAVPFGLELPYAKADGTPFGEGEANKLHVYPKNTLAKEPKVDKDFQKKGEKFGAKPDNPRSAEEKNKPEAHTVGDKIPYEVKTVFNANTKYQHAYWADQMTEGLTFNNDVTVKFGEQDAETGDFTVVTDGIKNSFEVRLTDAGLKKVNEQKAETTVTIHYTATLNGKAVVAVPESNDVTFHYGNKPSEGNTPVPNKPKNTELTFTKTWSKTAPKDGEWAKFEVYDANTGKLVATVKFADAAGTVTFTKGAGADEKVTGKAASSQPTNGWAYTISGLDDTHEYKVYETNNMGDTAVYAKGEDGQITIVNKDEGNPPPINPDEPKVVTYGKKFVKTEKDNPSVRLEGAEFYVINKNEGENNGKYLKAKDDATAKAEKDALDAAKKAYEDELANYDKLTDEQKNDTEGTNQKNTIAEKYKAYEKAYQVVAMQYEWVADKANALVLKSNARGQFYIAGLATGTYELEEKTAPKGYATLTTNVEFAINENSWNAEGDIDFEKESTGTNAQNVPNTKITIPQTGGIGTLVFALAGISLMGGAAYAMKKNKAEEQ